MRCKLPGTQPIDTARLTLRRFDITDTAKMFENWINDEKVQGNYGEPIYNSHDRVKTLVNTWISNYEKETFYRWAIVLKENSDNIGQIAFCSCDLKNNNADVEYCISRKYQNQGYATEALKGVIKFTFEETSFIRLQAFHRGKNPVSGKVLIRAGLNYEGTLCQSIRYEDPIEYDDKILYGIVRSDFLSSGL